MLVVGGCDASFFFSVICFMSFSLVPLEQLGIRDNTRVSSEEHSNLDIRVYSLNIVHIHYADPVRPSYARSPLMIPFV